MKTILLSAGDLSGERYAAELVREIRARLPQTRFVGMGGSAMAAAGVDLHVDQRQLAIGGIFEVLGSLSGIFRTWRRMQRCVRETRPDVIVLVDSGGFNLPFAKWARSVSSARILYYVAPQVWAWRPGRSRRLEARTDRIAVILSFEKAFYAARKISVDLVGHPVIDITSAESASGSQLARDTARARLGIASDETLLGLFPGSRRNELVRHLPLQLDAFLELRQREEKLRNLKAIVCLAPSLDREEALRIAGDRVSLAPDALRFDLRGDGSLLDACDVALLKPGTITVELMIRRKPMVVMGRVHPATAMVARRSLRVDWLSMPNLIANQEIVPEFLQETATRDRIATALAPLFWGRARDSQIEALRLASERLGPPGASKRVAAIVEEMLGTTSA